MREATYELRRQLGAGGFGVVYLAQMKGSGGFEQDVAIKVLRDVDPGGDALERLRDEARALGMLRHRAIVKVHGLEQLQGRWAVVMEYVEGADLSTLVKRHGRLPPAVVAEIGVEVASALHSAWSAKSSNGEPLDLLHRDVKPSNIRLTAHGGIKLMDFGIARGDFASREAQTRSSVLGTVLYMPPERLYLVGAEERHQGDVYSLGATLFELLTGERLGEGSPSQDAHREVEAEAETRLRRHCSHHALVEIVCSCLSYDWAERPDGAELANRLRKIGRRLPGELLAEYAERVVPAELESQSEAGAETAGKVEIPSGTMSIELDAPPPAPQPSAPRPAGPAAPEPPPARQPRRKSGAWLVPAVGVATAFVVLGVGGAAAWWWASRTEPVTPDEPVVAEAEPVAETSPEPLVEDPPEEPVPEPVPVEPDPTPVEVAPVTQTVKEEPARAEPTKVHTAKAVEPRVSLASGSYVPSGLRMKLGAVSYELGSPLEPGLYVLTYDGPSGPQSALRVQVRETSRVVVSCTELPMKCREVSRTE